MCFCVHVCNGVNSNMSVVDSILSRVRFTFTFNCLPFVSIYKVALVYRLNSIHHIDMFSIIQCVYMNLKMDNDLQLAFDLLIELLLC